MNVKLVSLIPLLLNVNAMLSILLVNIYYHALEDSSIASILLRYVELVPIMWFYIYLFGVSLKFIKTEMSKNWIRLEAFPCNRTNIIIISINFFIL